ncbi:hypothetical protein SETIT_5G215200v2 [Setaria italica]|uniref:Transposase Tnp1/En/Spm-like domain-containing protein n=1 Tax=Setaria italica TaxID=4555 RepID=A0A368R788_SETIT|nr:hypothetical protein SETIT_5G215200v2 [Setaria italica]
MMITLHTHLIMCTLPQMKCRRHPPKTVRLYLVSKQLLRRHIFRVLFTKRTRRVKAPSLNRSELLVTTDGKREIGGSMLGKEYVGFMLKVLKINVDSRNKGNELIPTPIFEIRTLIDAIGYTIPWPRSHVKKATSLNLKQPGDVIFQGRSEAAMERGTITGNEA